MRRNTSAVFRAHLLVSIHASVKDATNALATRAIMETGFNPRICKRCDPKDMPVEMIPKVSIHASVKDATAELAKIICQNGFNPRICKRCDKRRL